MWNDFFQDTLYDEVGAVECAPDDEGPCSTVPESAEEHGEGQVDVGARGAFLVATEGDVEVVAKPGGEGDVPALPEVGEADGGVGEAEIVLYGETEAEGDADGAGGVACEVAEDLTGEGEGANPGIHKADACGVFVDFINDRGEEPVCDGDFVEYADDEEGESPGELVAGGFARGDALGEEVFGADDGARDELGEEGDEEGEVEEGGPGFGFVAVGVDGVGEGLEGVEGDAYGEYDGGCCGGEGDAEGVDEGGEIIQEEGAVLEVGEEAQVAAEGAEEKETSCCCALCSVELFYNEPVYESGEPDEDDEGGIPCSVKEVGGDKEVKFFYFPGQGECMQGEDNAEEDEECEGVK